MRVNNIKDPMAEIRKEKNMNDLGESQRTNSFYDGSKLTEKIENYATKKYEMTKKKQNFENQKKRRDEVKNKLLEKYTKVEINNLINDYEEEEKKLLEYSRTWHTCINAKNEAKNLEKTIDKTVLEYSRKIRDFKDENEKADKAVKKLKECLKVFEEKQKEASNPDQEIEEVKEGPQYELKQKEAELNNAKKHFLALVESLARTKAEKEYVELRLFAIENPNVWVDEDKIDNLAKEISPIELPKWKRRLQAVADKQNAYFEMKKELNQEEVEDEFDAFGDDDEQTAMLKEVFDFKPEEFNPLSAVPVKDYVKEAREYISKVETGRFIRKKELENLEKEYNKALREQKNIEIKLDQISDKERETKNSKDKLQKAHEAKEQDYRLLKRVRDSYNAAYKDAFEKTGKLEALDLGKDINKIAGEGRDRHFG